MSVLLSPNDVPICFSHRPSDNYDSLQPLEPVDHPYTTAACHLFKRAAQSLNVSNCSPDEHCVQRTNKRIKNYNTAHSHILLAILLVVVVHLTHCMDISLSLV